MKQRLFPALLALNLVLGSWKGYIAIFREGNAEPYQIFPTAVASLPKVDQQALADGILVRSEKAMEALLEDYLS